MPAARKRIAVSGAREPLVLPAAELRDRTIKLFDSLERDDKLRDRFIADPVGLVEQRVHGRRLNKAQVSAANRLLFSLVGNAEIRAFLQDYGERTRDRDVDATQFASDLGAALAQHADPAILAGLASVILRPGFASSEDKFSKQYSYAVSDKQVTYNKQYAWTENKTKGLGGRDIDQVVNPAMLRSLSEQIVARAEQLAAQGRIAGL